MSFWDGMHPAWQEKLKTVERGVKELDDFIEKEIKEGREVLPARENIMRAFTGDPGDVKVVIVGQDPYPTPGHAVGFSFAVDPGIRPLPRSLTNIAKELKADIGVELEPSLVRWRAEGVLLLNRVLSVEAGKAGSHQKKGWEQVTQAAVVSLLPQKPVFILWGRPAQTLLPLLGDCPSVISAHPSPLSARRGFFGSNPFSETNKLLLGLGKEPVRW